MRYLLYVLIILVLISNLEADTRQDGWLIHIQCKQRVFRPLDTCEFSWKIIDKVGNNIFPNELKDEIEGFYIIINEGDNNVLNLSLPPDILSKEWITPARNNEGIYNIKVVARLKKDTKVTLSDSIDVVVSPFSLGPPTDPDQALKILMDWNGRRGYYNRVSPDEALKRAKETCTWLRKHADPAMYEDALNIIQKVENMQVFPWYVYCPIRGASLKVEGWVVGQFITKDEKRGMYVIECALPVDSEKAYNIEVFKGNLKYKTAYTHSEGGEFIIEELQPEIVIHMKTPALESKILMDGFPVSENWGEDHSLKMIANRRHEIKIQVREGPLLILVLFPSKAMEFTLQKQGDYYLLKEGEIIHKFNGYELELLRFSNK